MTDTITYSCQYCKKSYIRKSAYNTHLGNCKFHKLCKTNANDVIDSVIDRSSIVSENININTMNINIDNIFKILINLHNKYEKLETDYNELKKYVNITKNKINIIDYLNQHCLHDSFDFINFMNSITIGFSELDIIFKKDYVEGIFQIIVNVIEKMRGDGLSNIPIKAFTHKDGILYIYFKPENDNESKNESDHERGNKKWCVMSEEYLLKFIKYFDKKILTLFLEWKAKNELTMDKDLFSEIYILNMKKVLGGNFENKNKKIMIKNKLYKYLRVNIKNFVSYEFE